MNTRISISLSDAQIAVLKILGEQQKKPRTALFHDAVQDYIARHALASGPQDVFGLWRGKKTNSQTDGLQYQESLRSEWLAGLPQHAGLSRE